MCVVVNKHYEDYDVYIGRGSRWGNPASHIPGKGVVHVNTREQAVAYYRAHLWNEIRLGIVTTHDLLDLDGKRLGCFCKPQLCHGDIIKMAVEWAKKVLANKQANGEQI